MLVPDAREKLASIVGGVLALDPCHDGKLRVASAKREQMVARGRQKKKPLGKISDRLKFQGPRSEDSLVCGNRRHASAFQREVRSGERAERVVLKIPERNQPGRSQDKMAR